jgi:cytochrome P450
MTCIGVPEPAGSNPPGPKGAPLLGSLLAFRRDPLEFFTRSAREYGDVVRYRIGTKHVYLFVHPDDIKDVLVTHQHGYGKGRGLQWAKKFLGEGLLTSEGELHTRQRRLSQPAFHRQRIASYAGVMVEFAARVRDTLRDGELVDVARKAGSLTMAIAAKTLFDADVERESAAIGDSLDVIMRLFPRFTLPLAGLLDKLPLKSNREFARARELLDTTIYGMIAERRRSGEDRGDLLSMLLLARDLDGTGMSDRQLRDELMTLFLAGHETTSNALTWTLYLLSQNPAVEARLHAEVDQVLGQRLAAFDDVPRLGYAERVLAESMRLFPPAWAVGRRTLRDERVAGYLIPEGAFVVVSQFVTQRDARFFPDPLRFDPDRFLPERKAERPKYAYFPFSFGARQCIGESFAWMEGTLVLATLAQRLRFRLAPEQRVETEALMTLRPRYGMRMTVERRPR